MIIKVRFRDVFSKYFTTGPYTYNSFLKVEEGDLVLVDTKFGISLAQVEKTNLTLTKPEEQKLLKEVIEVCKTKYPMPEEQWKR